MQVIHSYSVSDAGSMARWHENRSFLLSLQAFSDRRCLSDLIRLSISFNYSGNTHGKIALPDTCSLHSDNTKHYLQQSIVTSRAGKTLPPFIHFPGGECNDIWLQKWGKISAIKSWLRRNHSSLISLKMHIIEAPLHDTTSIESIHLQNKTEKIHSLIIKAHGAGSPTNKTTSMHSVSSLYNDFPFFIFHIYSPS